MKANEQAVASIEAMPPPQRRICEDIRAIIAGAHSDMEERFAWSRPVYAVNGKLVCYLKANKADVSFGFEHGAKLNDPKGMLAGTGANMRHVKIASPSQVDSAYLRSLLEQAVAIAV